MKTQKTRQSWNPISRKGLATIILALTFPTFTAAQESVRVRWNPNPETNIAGYSVYLGTRSGTYSSSQKIVTGTSATLSGLMPFTTYYCAVQAYNTAGLTSEMSAEVAFTTQPVPDFFESWAAAGGLTGSAAAPDAIPFSDGLNNLVKYAFNLKASGPDVRVLTSGTGTAGLPVFSLERSGPQAWFKVEFLRRKGGEMEYLPKISTNLVNFELMSGTTTVTNIDSIWERVVIQKPVDLATTPKLFGIVEVAKIHTPAGLYSDWSVAAGLTGAAAATDAVRFNDGVNNLTKYAFNLNPYAADLRILANGTGTAGLPYFTLDRSGAQPQFKVVFLRRKNSGLVYTPKISTDLATYQLMAGTTTTITTIDDDWERVTVLKSIDLATTPKLFGTVEVMLP